MPHETMLRVNKAHPCPVCEKPDWCLYSEDGSAAICARVSEGSRKRSGDAGYLHILRTDDRGPKVVRRIRRAEGKRKYLPDFDVLVRQYQLRMSQRQLRWLGASLGVSPQSLKRLCAGYDGKAFTFPMRDENMRIIGIRRRFGDGYKRALTGSTNGLFIPSGLNRDKPLFICEGPTDCAAALDLGFEAIGRPNCDSKIAMTVRLARGRRVVIICDNDVPGREGAKKLADELIGHCPHVKIICPPCAGMDLREWKRQGFDGGRLRYGS